MDIDQKIKRLENEQTILVQSHQATVARYEETAKKFQEIISQNHTRFHQIKGALEVLRQLKGETNDNSIPTACGDNRATDVHTLRQP